MNMQRNFTQYVADVEVQKLDHLLSNLAKVYGVYDDWGNAIQAQILQIEGEAGPDDYDRLSRWWLRRQYDIAMQQTYFENHRYIDLDRKQNETANSDELRWMEMNLPSEFEPFAGLKFPLSANSPRFERNPNTTQKQFVSMPDRLGLAHRLSLYDAKHQFILGEAYDGQVAFRPIVINQKVVGYLGLKPSLDQEDALSINFFSNQKRYLFLVYAFSVLTSLIAALLLATYFKNPIQRLLRATRELTQGNYSHQVAINRNDEIGDLSQQLNQLALILEQHEVSRRQWVADTSHELKTPLAVLQAQIEAMQDGIRKATPEHLAAMMRQVSSLKKLTQDLADLAQAEAQQLSFYFSEVDAWDVIEQEIDHFKPKFEQADLSIRAQGQPILLQLDRDRFKQILVNLLGNSIRYTESGGQIHLHTQETATHWTLYVDDSPLGLSDEQLAQLGQRFYRVDDSRTRSTGGTGLGLALSVKIAQGLGGQLTFAHSPLGGLRCQLTFPKQIKQ